MRDAAIPHHSCGKTCSGDNMEHWQSKLASLMAELRIIKDHILK